MRIVSSNFLMIWILVLAFWTCCLCAAPVSNAPPVTVSEDVSFFTLANGLITAQIEKRSGNLASLKYQNLELLARHGSGAEGGYWSSVGRGRPGSEHHAFVRVAPVTNGGARVEVSCRLFN